MSNMVNTADIDMNVAEELRTTLEKLRARIEAMGETMVTPEQVRQIASEVFDAHPARAALAADQTTLQAMLVRFEGVATGIQTVFSTEISNRTEAQRRIDSRMDAVGEDIRGLRSSLNTAISLMEASARDAEALTARVVKVERESATHNTIVDDIADRMADAVRTITGVDPRSPNLPPSGNSVVRRVEALAKGQTEIDARINSLVALMEQSTEGQTAYRQTTDARLNRIETHVQSAESRQQALNRYFQRIIPPRFMRFAQTRAGVFVAQAALALTAAGLFGFDVNTAVNIIRTLFTGG